MPKSKNSPTKWALPPFQTSDYTPKGEHHVSDGEPMHLELVRFEGETLHTNLFEQCCDCGLEHHHTYTVFRDDDGRWFLTVRVYRIPNTGKTP